VNSQNRYVYAESDPINNADPSGHAVGSSSYERQMEQAGGINEIYNCYVGWTLDNSYAKAASAFSARLNYAYGVDYRSYAAINSISGISQATADAYITLGAEAALRVGAAWGCTPGALTAAAIATYASHVNTAKETTNQRIAAVKSNKYAQYQQYQAWLAEQARIAEEQRIAELFKAALPYLLYNIGAIRTPPTSVAPSSPLKTQKAPALGGYSLSDIGHLILDLVGLIPGVGEFADGGNALWYAAEGDWTSAGLSAAGAIPFAGWGATAAKLGIKGARAVGGEVVEAGIKTEKTTNTTLGLGSTGQTITNDVIGAPRVGSANKTDAYHSFNDIVDNSVGLATRTDLGNANLYQLEGSLNGIPGRFEWIIQDGKTTHRLFVENGTMNGVPIRK
jgi:hypothetical protein